VIFDLGDQVIRQSPQTGRRRLQQSVQIAVFQGASGVQQKAWA
jgi:hypothetical protein